MKELSKEEILRIHELHLVEYEDSTFGKLSELYDRVKNINLSKTSEEDLRLLFFEIYSSNENIIDYAKTNVLKTEKLNNLIRMVKSVNEIKNQIDIVSNEDLKDWQDAFNFDLNDPEFPQNKIEHIQGAYDIEERILKIIEQTKTSKIVPSKLNKRNAGRKKDKRIEAKKILQKIQFESKKEDLIINLNAKYKNCSGSTFSKLIFCLIHLGYIDNKLSKVVIREAFEQAIQPKSITASYFNKELAALFFQKKNTNHIPKEIDSIIDTINKIIEERLIV